MLVNQKFFSSPHVRMTEVSSVKRALHDRELIFVTDEDGNAMRPLAESFHHFFNGMEVHVVPLNGHVFQVTQPEDHGNPKRKMKVEKMVHPDIFVDIPIVSYDPSEDVKLAMNRRIGHGYRSPSAMQLDEYIKRAFLYPRDGLIFDLIDEEGNPFPLSINAFVGDNVSKVDLSFNAVRKCDEQPLMETLIHRARIRRILALEKMEKRKNDNLLRHRMGHRDREFELNDVRYAAIARHPTVGNRVDHMNHVYYFKSAAERDAFIEERTNQFKQNDSTVEFASGVVRIHTGSNKLRICVYLTVPDDIEPEDVAKHFKMFNPRECDTGDRGRYFIATKGRQASEVVFGIDATRVQLIPNLVMMSGYLQDLEHLYRANQFNWAAAICDIRDEREHRSIFYRNGSQEAFNTLRLERDLPWAALTGSRMTKMEYTEAMITLKCEDPNLESTDVVKCMETDQAFGLDETGTFLKGEGARISFTPAMTELTVKKAMIPVFPINIYIDLYVDLQKSIGVGDDEN